MQLASLKLRDFRNYRKLEVNFESGFHLILGSNAQGKTNLLEAIYLLSTLRSFRGVGNAQIIHHGKLAFFVGGLVLGQTENNIQYYWAANERKLKLNQKLNFLTAHGAFHGYKALLAFNRDLTKI